MANKANTGSPIVDSMVDSVASAPERIKQWASDHINAARKLLSPDEKAAPAKPDTSWHDEKTKEATESFQKKVPKYHSGGVVRKTGLARLRKGETVLTKTQMKDKKLGTKKSPAKSKRLSMGKKSA